MKKIFFVLFSVVTATCFAQKVTGNLNFSKGQKLDVVTNVNLTSQSMMGPSSGTITFTDTYTVSDASANSYTLTKTPKQIKMSFTMGSQEIKMDSDNPKDLNGMFGEPIKEIMSQKPEFTIDATGKIVSVKGTEKNKNAGEKGSGMMGMMLPGLDIASALPKEGGASFFQVIPAREVGIGDTWTEDVDAEGNKYSTVYKVKNISDAEIIVDFSSEGTTVNSQDAGGMKIDVNAATKSTGTSVVDKATGLVKQKTTTSTIESTIKLGGQEMTSTSKITMVANVKPS